jgi:hypothetical protein
MSIPVKFTVLGNTHKLASAPASPEEARELVLSIYPALSDLEMSFVHEGLPLRFPITQALKF